MMKRWEGKLDEDPYYNQHFSRGGGDFNLRADLLRPRLLRRHPGDPALASDGLLPTSRAERERLMKILQGALTASREERRELMEVHQRAARDSYRTTMVPVRGDRSVRIAAVEGFVEFEGPAPRRDG